MFTVRKRTKTVSDVEEQTNTQGQASRQSRVLIGAHMSIAGGLPLAIGRGEALGCTAIQIFTKNASQWRSPPLEEETVKAFKREQRRTGILVVAHDAYLINLASPDSKLLERSRKAFLDEMERAEQLEIPFLIMHPGAHKDAGEDAGIQKVVDSFNLLLKSTSGFRVKIAVENTAGQGTALGYRIEHLKRMVAETVAPERMAVCFDTCHAFAAGYDIRDAAGYERTLADLDAAVGKACCASRQRLQEGARTSRGPPRAYRPGNAWFGTVSSDHERSSTEPRPQIVGDPQRIRRPRHG